MKRPAGKNMKKPAKKSKETINESVKALKDGLIEEDIHLGQAEAEQEDEEAQLQTRDKMKAEKFQRMRVAGQLPDFIIKMHDEEARLSPNGHRHFRTQMINKMFKKKKDGTWEMDLSCAMFTQYKSVYERKYSKDQQEALPKSLMVGMYFHNDEVKFNKALADGEISLVRTEGGVQYYAYRRFITGEDKGSDSRFEASGQRKGTADEFHMVSDLFAKLQWSFKPSARMTRCFKMTSFPGAFRSCWTRAWALARSC